VRWYWQLPDSAQQATTNRSPRHFQFESPKLVMQVWWGATPLQVERDNSESGSPVAWCAAGYGELRTGQRIRMVSPACHRLLVATFVGKSAPTPCQFRVADAWIRCDSRDGNSRVFSMAPKVPSDIQWDLVTESEFVTCAAGVRDGTTAGSDELLCGLGQWRALRRSQPIIETALQFVDTGGA
jgi:hypothetical protein